MEKTLTSFPADFRNAKVKYFSLIASSQLFNRDRRFYENIKRLLLKDQQKLEAGQPVNLETAYHKEYEIIYMNGAPELIKKRTSDSEPLLLFLPIEDSYRYLYRIHFGLNHAGLSKMNDCISREYALNSMFIKFFIECCPVCSQQEKNAKSNPLADYGSGTDLQSGGKVEVYNRKLLCHRNINITKMKLTKVLFYIVSMTKKRDGNFKYILLYQDIFTCYLLLRPLISNNDCEVASELVKIFTSFGPPKEIYVHIGVVKLFNKAMAFVSRFGLDFGVIHKIFHSGNTYMKNIRMLKDYIYGMVEDMVPNWGTGCHMLQVNLNNNLMDPQFVQARNKFMGCSSNKTPHLSLFENEPLKYFRRNNFDSDSDNEDLKGILDDSEFEYDDDEMVSQLIDNGLLDVPNKRRKIVNEKKNAVTDNNN